MSFPNAKTDKCSTHHIYEEPERIPDFSCVIKVCNTPLVYSSTSNSSRQQTRGAKLRARVVPRTREGSNTSVPVLKRTQAIHNPQQIYNFNQENDDDYQNQCSHKSNGKDLQSSLKLKFKDWNVKEFIPKNCLQTVEYADKAIGTDSKILFRNDSRLAKFRSKSNQRSTRTFGISTGILKPNTNSNRDIASKSVQSSRGRLETPYSRTRLAIEQNKRSFKDYTQKMKIIDTIKLTKNKLKRFEGTNFCMKNKRIKTLLAVQKALADNRRLMKAGKINQLKQFDFKKFLMTRKEGTSSTKINKIQVAIKNRDLKISPIRQFICRSQSVGRTHFPKKTFWNSSKIRIR
ncbi:unnamed protein product [Moneuplotes crassus]|uniref:Uncharacterized protein n=1 Tax=Euplotes crassus TaxID=5936 RepID=A0AAD1XHA7_EUPCR|nr:unnamed protein product [Moneuplotes crassus]